MIDKKVGILTFQDSYNYGANLQAFALRKSIENLGYRVEIINYQSTSRKYSRQSFLHRIRSVIWKNTAKRFFESKVRKRKTNDFKKNYMNLSTNIYFTKDDLKKCCRYYNAIVVGSDQVWNNHNINGDDSFYLSFVEKIPAIAYAPSFGRSTISNKEKLQIKPYLEKISDIAMREITGARIVSDIIKKDIDVVADPTLLLSKQEWNQIAPPRIIKEKYVLCYYMPGDKKAEEKIRILSQQISEKYDCKIVNIGKKEYSKIKRLDSDRFDDGPEDFISLIRDAQYIITNSYHGTVFSIIYEKEFWVPIHKNSEGGGYFNTRILELLEILGLPERLKDIDTNEMIDEKDVKINYEKVKHKLDELKEKSENFLKTALEKI